MLATAVLTGVKTPYSALQQLHACEGFLEKGILCSDLLPMQKHNVPKRSPCS